VAKVQGHKELQPQSAKPPCTCPNKNTNKV
jgi:hypothetical protein